MDKFVHLHLHSHYSILDGIIQFPDLIRKLKQHNSHAVALTDHGNLFGAIEFYRMCISEGIKPIIGCEVYMCEDVQDKNRNNYHLVLLAKNNAGYRNLVKLVSYSHIEGYYYKPRIDCKILEKHAEGLIGLSACIKGEISKNLLNGKFLDAEEAVLKYKKIFGPDCFYLEIMDHGMKEEKLVNEYLADLAEITGVGIVATNDVHFLESSDYEVHSSILAVKTGKSVFDEDAMRLSSDSFYLKSYEEMKESVNNEEYLKNTVKIANMCNVDIPRAIHLPRFAVEGDLSVEDYFESKLKNRFEEYLLHADEERKTIARDRLRYEVSVIKKMKYVDYFLIVADFVDFARESGIMVGPGRGSAAGSFVSYILGITRIDPLEHDLLFERFLNPDRISLPDIDIDFSDERRREVIEYVKNRYGEDHVAQIITFGTMHARNALKDIARVNDVPYNIADSLCKLMVSDHKASLKESFERRPEFKYRIEASPKLKMIYNTASKVEGIIRNISTHAAGVVLSDNALHDYIPLCRAGGDSQEIVTQYDKDSLEYVGLLKMDFLGLKTLSLIESTIALVDRFRGVEINIEKIPVDDQPTFKLLSEGNTIGIFQLENPGVMTLLKKYQPERLDDIIAFVALWRPGPIRSGMVDDFINRKNNRGVTEYIHPCLEKILKPTYGVILYQEQVMQIANSVGGFSLGEADMLRKAMSKKQEDDMEHLREKFCKGAESKGIDLNSAEEIYQLMAHFAGYGFNKAHSACYGLIAYQTAYLKSNFPLFFMTSLLNSELNDHVKLDLYIKECKRMGIRVKPPSINLSNALFHPVGDRDIIFGFAAIKHVGFKTASMIESTRKEKGKFQSYLQFIKSLGREHLNLKVLEALIKAGCFKSDFGNNISELLNILEKSFEWVLRLKNDQDYGQRTIFDLMDGDCTDSEMTIEPLEEFQEFQLMIFEKQYLGMYLLKHPLNPYKNYYKCLQIDKVDEIINNPAKKEVKLFGIFEKYSEKKTKNSDVMAFADFTDITGSLQIILFPGKFMEYKPFLDSKEPVFLEGVAETDEKTTSVIPTSIEKKSSYFKQNNFSVVFYPQDEKELGRIHEFLFDLRSGKNYVIISIKSNNSIVDVCIDKCVIVDEKFFQEIEKQGFSIRVVRNNGKRNN